MKYFWIFGFEFLSSAKASSKGEIFFFSANICFSVSFPMSWKWLFPIRISWFFGNTNQSNLGWRTSWPSLNAKSLLFFFLFWFFFWIVERHCKWNKLDVSSVSIAFSFLLMFSCWLSVFFDFLSLGRIFLFLGFLIISPSSISEQESLSASWVFLASFLFFLDITQSMLLLRVSHCGGSVWRWDSKSPSKGENSTFCGRILIFGEAFWILLTSSKFGPLIFSSEKKRDKFSGCIAS